MLKSVLMAMAHVVVRKDEMERRGGGLEGWTWSYMEYILHMEVWSWFLWYGYQRVRYFLQRGDDD
jgi:hypothetical protein